MRTTIDTPAGPFTMLLSGDAVIASGFTDDENELWPQVHPRLRTVTDGDATTATAAVHAYFAGNLGALDSVTVLQHSDGAYLPAAWDALRQLKPGMPTSYAEFARLTGRPAAVRAAAQACARNAATLFVPCHRVVRSDGSLGGYRWGLSVKRHLLDHEESRS